MKIDLRSDTVTKPTKEMRLAMMNAEVGDDVFGDDPTVNELERYAAELMGKEKALFVPSGTMGNQICVNIQTDHGNEIILQENHHIFKYEAAGTAALSGVQCRTLKGTDGCYQLEELVHAIREKGNVHYPETKLICVENTHNMEGGMVVPLSHMSEIRNVADEYGLNIHLDGARIFHAAEYLGAPVSEIAKYADTVMFCLSKGLASPVGSLIAGSEEQMSKARAVRKRFGGGMRQVGVLAACGLISLKEMTKRLGEDHSHAKQLAEGIAKIQGLSVDLSRVHTNIVIFDIDASDVSADILTGKLKEKGVLTTAVDGKKIRLIPHYEISDDDISYVLGELNEVMHELQS
ncbi:MAG: GntG family PLP-dependent aldolase [Anaerofustis sp.]